MKKILSATVVGLLAFASVAGAQTASFNVNLTVGSKGADVAALQTWLIANGYHIAAIESGAAAKGYFGSQTQSAVKMYQSAVGLPSTGFVGPLTRAKLNGGSVATVPPSTACPVGFQCIPVGGTTTTPPASTGGITTPGAAGSLALTLQSTPSNGTSVDKGQSADVVRYKLQAGDSDMAVNSLALDFSDRLWLYASSVTLKDDAGAVIASKTNLSANDFTEITVGTQYRLRIPFSYVVPKAGIRYVTANVQMLGISDRSAATLSISRAEVRSVDGTGVTDTQIDNNSRSFSYTGSNNGQIVVTVDASSPLKRLVQISTSAETNDVVIGVVNVKSQNRDATLRSLNFSVITATSTGSVAPSTVFTDLKIKAGNLVYSTDGVPTVSGGYANFTNLVIPLPKDQYVSLTILAKVAKDTNNALDGVMASSTFTASSTNPHAEDSTYNTVAVNATTIISNDAIFSASSALVSNTSNSVALPFGTGSTSTSAVFNFTVTAGDNTLFLSKTTSTLVSTSTTGTGLSASLGTLISTPDSLAGDTSTYLVVPAGSSRALSISGSVSGASGSNGTVKISSVKYGTSSGALTANSIDYNLGGLQTSAVVIP